jgi:hypothetical protein
MVTMRYWVLAYAVLFMIRVPIVVCTLLFRVVVDHGEDGRETDRV